MPEDSKHVLPERYAPLVKYVFNQFPEQAIAFESAFRRIESSRLLEAQKLRKTLRSYWSATDEQLQTLSPLELVHCFEPYAEAIFRAAGERCLTQFHDSESYSAFLQVVQNWIVDAILPEYETFKESQADLLTLAEDMLTRADRKRLDDPHVRELAAAVVDVKSNAQAPSSLRNAIDQARIIRLRESFSAFEARFFWSKETVPNGDWGNILYDSVLDALLTGSISPGGHSAGTHTVGALSDAVNREAAQLILIIALDQLQGSLLSDWWGRSADAHISGMGSPVAAGESVAPVSKGEDATTALAQARCEWLDGKLAGEYSDVDLAKTTKIAYGTIKRYRSGARIRSKSRQGLREALKEYGISCEFSDVPR